MFKSSSTLASCFLFYSTPFYSWLTKWLTSVKLLHTFLGLNKQKDCTFVRYVNNMTATIIKGNMPRDWLCFLFINLLHKFYLLWLSFVEQSLNTILFSSWVSGVFSAMIRSFLVMRNSSTLTKIYWPLWYQRYKKFLWFSIFGQRPPRIECFSNSKHWSIFHFRIQQNSQTFLV